MHTSATIPAPFMQKINQLIQAKDKSQIQMHLSGANLCELTPTPDALQHKLTDLLTHTPDDTLIALELNLLIEEDMVPDVKPFQPFYVLATPDSIVDTVSDICRQYDARYVGEIDAYIDEVGCARIHHLTFVIPKGKTYIQPTPFIASPAFVCAVNTINNAPSIDYPSIPYDKLHDGLPNSYIVLKQAIRASDDVKSIVDAFTACIQTITDKEEDPTIYVNFNKRRVGERIYKDLKRLADVSKTVAHLVQTNNIHHISLVYRHVHIPYLEHQLRVGLE